MNVRNQAAVPKEARSAEDLVGLAPEDEAELERAIVEANEAERHGTLIPWEKYFAEIESAGRSSGSSTSSPLAGAGRCSSSFELLARLLDLFGEQVLIRKRRPILGRKDLVG